MKRKVEGRNVEDSDAELYAEYHGTDHLMKNDLELSGCHDDSTEIRHRVTFSCQPDERGDNQNKYDYHPDLSSTIETNFTALYQKKADDTTKILKSQRSEDTNPSEKRKSSESVSEHVETGYDFGSKFDALYKEQRHIMEDSRRRETERRQSQERHNISEIMGNRSKSWSEGMRSTCENFTGYSWIQDFEADFPRSA